MFNQAYTINISWQLQTQDWLRKALSNNYRKCLIVIVDVSYDNTWLGMKRRGIMQSLAHLYSTLTATEPLITASQQCVHKPSGTYAFPSRVRRNGKNSNRTVVFWPPKLCQKCSFCTIQKRQEGVWGQGTFTGFLTTPKRLIVRRATCSKESPCYTASTKTHARLTYPSHANAAHAHNTVLAHQSVLSP